jgi:hypothetical protein
MGMEQLFRNCRDLIAAGDFETLYKTEVERPEQF